MRQGVSKSGSHACLALGLVLVGVLLAPFSTASETLPELARDTLDEYLTRVLPEAEEIRFREIPWRMRFHEAVDEAARVRKPLLIWAMNGHPLGCT